MSSFPDLDELEQWYQILKVLLAIVRLLPAFVRALAKLGKAVRTLRAKKKPRRRQLRSRR